MPDKHSLLKRYWGYDAFRPLQEEIIDSALAGSDTMVLLPTGGGKSLCYQLPTLMMEGLCLVVSPLIALMKDQVQHLNDRHLKAACVVSGMSGEESTGVLLSAINGGLKFLYVSPERLRQRQFIEHFRKMNVCLIAVDEAHCVSQWGYDFRPPYLQIADIRIYHPEAPLIALTATATPVVADDICLHLQMKACRRFQSSFIRPNLVYMVLHDSDKSQRLLRIVRRVEGSGIVYVRNRRATQTLARFLEASGVSSTFYHAGLDATERDQRQSAWMNGRCQVMVATNAFGMGIDKADVRFVVHMDIPDSLEAYFQEAGRAGRDGQRAYAVLICDSSDIERLSRDFAIDYPELTQVRNVYRAWCNYYRVPVGGGADSQFDFDIEKICFNYNFTAREFYGACRILEREGLISIPEQEDAYSTVYIPVTRNELYRFQINHQRLGDMLQVVIRTYPGLMECAVSIDERKIASKCYSSPAEVVNMLQQLHEMHIIHYRPSSHGPQLYFLTERVDERLIYLSEQNYAQLKSAAQQRMKSIVDYVSDDSRCRSRQLVAYFGEQSTTDCGMCDVCLKSKSHLGDKESAIEKILQKSPMGARQLVQLLTDEGYVDVGDTLREMIDRGELLLDGNAQLHLAF